MIEVGDLVRPTDYACRNFDSRFSSCMGIVTEIKAEQLGRRAIVYVLWVQQDNGARRTWEAEPIARSWLEKVV